MNAARQNGTTLQSVERACSVLAIIADARRPMTARELAAALGINPSTTYHLLNTLEKERFIERDQHRHYRIGARLIEIANRWDAEAQPDPRLLAGLDELNALSGETGYLGMWQGDEVVSVAVREGRGGVRVASVALGYREHGYARALSRALLAYRDEDFIDRYLARANLEQLTPATTLDLDRLKGVLEDVRLLGIATEREEFMLGVCCVGAPVFGSDGTPIASFSISVPKARFDADGASLTNVLRDVVQRTSQRLTNREEAK